MTVDFHPEVVKQLQRLPRPVFIAALAAIVELSHDPRPAGVKKLVGSEGDWRIRIGEYRIVFAVDDSRGRLTIMRVQHRREVYR